MTVVVFDNFNRADSPTSLGTATTGQVWANVPGEGNVLPGDPYGILSNQGWWNRNGSGAAGDGLAALETGLTNAKASVRLMDVLAGGLVNLRNMGILFHYVDTTHYMFATYARAGGGLWRLYRADGTAPTHIGPDSAAAPVNGDTLSVAYCGNTVDIQLNGVSQPGYPITMFPVMSATLAAGTMCGLQSSGGVISAPPYQLFEDFQVETNNDCEAAVWTIPPIRWSAEGTVESPPVPAVNTMTFDAGIGNNYFLCSQLSDGGNDLRSKTIKSLRATGKLTNASMQSYSYDVSGGIDVTEIEDGTNPSVSVTLPNSSQVAQSPRQNVNVPNSVLSAVRIEGNDRGEDERDRIDELCQEWAEAGVRR